MKTRKCMNKFSTGALVALGLSIDGLHSIAEAQTQQEGEQNQQAAEAHHHHAMEGSCGMRMRMDMNGMVMHENKDELPKDCDAISEEVNIQIRAGVKYSEQYPGTVFGFDQHQWKVQPCSRITVEFINDDHIRHQWMVHGLPKYLYPRGMFHIEANGQQSKTGVFIVPSSHYTYLVHCDIAQHMEKGMKAQLVVGNGRGDLPSIPGISAPKFVDAFSSSHQ